MSHGGIDAWQRAEQSGLSPCLLMQTCGQTPGSRLQPLCKARMLLLNLTVVLQVSHLFPYCYETLLLPFLARYKGSEELTAIGTGVWS